MGVGDNERIYENFVNRGLGNSGIASRTIQQANIDELRNLNASLAESRATLENQRQDQLAKMQAKITTNFRSAGLGSMRSGGAGFNPTEAGAVLSLSGAPGQDGLPQKFQIQYASGLGGTISHAFNTEAELVAFLRANPDVAQNLTTSGVGENAVSNQQIGNLANQGIGVTRVAQPLARQVLNKNPQPSGIVTATNQMRTLAAGSQSKGQKSESAARPADPVQVVQQGGTLTEGETARLVTTTLADITSPTYSGSPFRKAAILAAYQKGTLGSLLVNNIKKGYGRGI